MEPSECRRCDDYGVLDTGDWLARPTPCPDCALGKAEAAERERDEQDRATGAAFRLLVESGEQFAVVYMDDHRGGTIGVEVAGCGRDYAPTLPEAVLKALGPERTEPQ